MGCTSSAQNMPPSLTNSVSEKDIEATIEKAMVEESGIINENGNESNGIQVLPTCDTLGESAHLDRNKKSLIDMTNPELDKDNPNPSNGIVDKNYNRSTHAITDNLKTDVAPTEEKLTTLEEVVEKVVELYVDNPVESKPTEESSNNDEPPKQEIELQEEETKNKQEDSEAMEEEVAEEPASPSQSQSSRATRWEALADIAAELPPSLAVDPITGQIYSLTK